MYQLTTLKNGLSLIRVDRPYLESVTTLVAVGAGSRYETKNISGLSHFLEHMFFKGSKKYPSAEAISKLVDSIGAVNNAATDKEVTYYWIKSSAQHLELASDILSSMLKEPLFLPDEIEKERGVILEEIKMYKDMPSRYIFDLYERLQFGDQPLGWEIAGNEESVSQLQQRDLQNYLDTLYRAENMALVYVGRLPKNIHQIADKFFGDLPKKAQTFFLPYQRKLRKKARVDIFYKQTDQAYLMLGVEGFDRSDDRRYAAKLLSLILGEGMSSRLYLEIREKRGWAYHVSSFHHPYLDTGVFAVYGGIRLDKVEDVVKIILEQFHQLASKPVTEEELAKAKQMERGRLDLRSESTNFLAEYFGTEYVLDRKLESFQEYLAKIDAITSEQIQAAADSIFQSHAYNLQLIAPLKNQEKIAKILQTK